ncbi:MAG: hypothetical protein JNL40_16110 [Cyclobacteriaceae bacterium]|nr:hypothetical protein [Cyclobacteriaceae bacterium]
MPINKEALRQWINSHYGHGSWNAPIWFVSHEDGGGDTPEEVAERLDYFHRTHPEATEPTLCDIRAMYQQIAFRMTGPRAGTYQNLFEYRFGSHAQLSSVWKNLIAFAHACRNKPLPDSLTYQKKSFGSTKEALIKLYPLPSPHNHAWYYSWLNVKGFDFLKSRDLYEEHVYSRRMQGLLSSIASHHPEVVLMYGMNNINKLKKSIQDYFQCPSFKMIKAVKGQIPQHHLGQAGRTKILITTQIPALRHNRVETGFDWEALGKSIQ